MGTVRNARVNQGGPKCAGIVGLGLIGGSFARGYAQAPQSKSRGYAQAGVRVLAWDPDDDVMTAASMGTVAGALNEETLGECDIIVLACYPEACIEWLEAHAQALADATDTEDDDAGLLQNLHGFRSQQETGSRKLIWHKFSSFVRKS